MADSQNTLPLEVVEHIHSLIEGNEVVRTSLISKLAHGGRSERRNICFDARLFRANPPALRILANRTFNRYEDSRLKINTMTIILDNADNFISLCILRAVLLGVVNLVVERPDAYWHGRPCWIPSIALRSKTLSTLSITNCTIELLCDEVPCPNLNSVYLSRVLIDGDLFTFFVARCPLLESLECDARLLSFTYALSESTFSRLESLTLNNLAYTYPLYFKQLVQKFPFLKHLTIQDISKSDKIEICRKSIETITIVEYYQKVDMEIDVPNLRKFHFVGVAFSFVAIQPTVREWESEIRIMCIDPTLEWLSSLRALLFNFTQSKISLSVHVKYEPDSLNDWSNLCDPAPVVKSLRIMGHVPDAGLVYGLFRICRPRIVKMSSVNHDDIFMSIAMKLIDNSSLPELDLYIPHLSVHGLKEVSVQVYDLKKGEWRNPPITDNPHSVNPECRLKLSWTSEACTSR